MRTNKKVTGDLIPARPPALTPEGRQALLTSYAYDLLERHLRDGTATSQEIIHVLKENSLQKQLEIEKLRKENALLNAKTEAIASEKEQSKKYQEAIEAMRRYSAHVEDDQVLF